MPKPKGRRLPLAPLELIVRPETDEELGRALGLPYDQATVRRIVQRWKVEGLTLEAADKAAAFLDLHPVNVWGVDWFEDRGRDPAEPMPARVARDRAASGFATAGRGRHSTASPPGSDTGARDVTDDVGGQ